MKPTPWFSIDTPPVRDGHYEVRDPSTSAQAMWQYWTQPGLPGYWVIGGAGVVQGVYGLQWRGVTDEIWTTRLGEKIPIFAMHEEHAKNSLRMVIRVAREKQATARRAALLSRALFDGDF